MLRSASPECEGASWWEREREEYCEMRVGGLLMVGGGLPMAMPSGRCEVLWWLGSCMLRGSGAGPRGKGNGEAMYELRRGLQLLLPPSPYEVTCRGRAWEKGM